MLQPIPKRILTKTATISVPTGVDSWQKPTYTTTTVYYTHLQNTNEVRKTKDNTEIVLRSILFIDVKISTPSLDYLALERTAETNNHDMKVTVDSVDYKVQIVDAVPDDTGATHHYELGLV